MKEIQNFFRLRRQSGKVKAALLLFLLAAFFGVHGVEQLKECALGLGEPVEYLLQFGTGGAVFGEKLRELQKMEGVTGVSRQREYTITRGEKSLAVTELSAQYLAQCYGIEESGFRRHFWLSPQAFSSFVGKGTEPPAHLSYRQAEVLCNGVFSSSEQLPGDLAGAVTSGTSEALRGSTELRVMFPGPDLSGVTVSRLEGLGFSVVNSQQLSLQEQEFRLLLICCCYDLTACALAAIGGWALYALELSVRQRRAVLD